MHTKDRQRFRFRETLTALRGRSSVSLQELGVDAENAPVHVLKLSWVNRRRNSSKLSEVPISARFCCCVHFQSQTFVAAFKLRNFVVLMHFICTSIPIITPNDAQSPVLDNLQTDRFFFSFTYIS